VTIGTALLIVVLSVFNGFFDVIQGLLLQNDPDLRIESTASNAFLFTGDMEKKLSDIPEIQAMASYVEGKALLAFEQSDDKVVQVQGIDPDQYFKVNNFNESISEGTLDLSVRNKKPGMLINGRLMNELNLRIDDEVVLLSASGMRKSLTQFSLPRSFRFQIRGSYSQVQITEGAGVFIDKEAAQRLFEMRNTVSGIDLRISNTDEAESVKEKLQATL
ncbi:MAG: ABC transporter permease, partial [Aliifodinibius sp.]|nr:ABC transporter permease [candidate division Zixibacteria bacterium]NIT60666.1 ABC transporter permease [Fodinibius sp.]NIS48314.1 ABC transporter permease [candidate division Zixibacteria bacterium]NIU16434.1 ABC transporter permease [candidate division Zixibacteria bacterium]NIV08553.1 ABC transporter permease [candidate division Zixibacteria bacterium]